MVRNVTLSLLIILMFFPIASAVNAESKQMNEDVKKVNLNANQINKLKSSGYPEDIIEIFTEQGYTFEELSSMEYVKSDEKFYKITETVPNGYVDTSGVFDYANDGLLNLRNGYTEDDFDYQVEEIDRTEYLNALKQPDKVEINATHTTTTSYKRMTTTITKINNKRYKLTNNVVWTKMPYHRKHDIIGVGINQNTSPIPGTEWARQTWTTSVSRTQHHATYTPASPKWSRSNGGYGLYFKLKGPVGQTYHSIRMYMEYEITPNVSTVTVLDGYGHYHHLEKSYNITPSFTIRGMSISINYKSDYTSHPGTHVQIRR